MSLLSRISWLPIQDSDTRSHCASSQGTWLCILFVGWVYNSEQKGSCVSFHIEPEFWKFDKLAHALWWQFSQFLSVQSYAYTSISSPHESAEEDLKSKQKIQKRQVLGPFVCKCTEMAWCSLILLTTTCRISSDSWAWPAGWKQMRVYFACMWLQNFPPEWSVAPRDPRISPNSINLSTSHPHVECWATSEVFQHPATWGDRRRHTAPLVESCGAGHDSPLVAFGPSLNVRSLCPRQSIWSVFFAGSAESTDSHC